MNNNTYFLLLLLVLWLHCFIVCLAMTTKNFTSDQFALVEFKHRIVDPQICIDKQLDVLELCLQLDWCFVHERVIALNLRGTISPHLGNLSFLHSLDLSTNYFYGHLPKQLDLGQLHRLRLLRLSVNGRSGEIPLWLGIYIELKR
ncbi:hypothetical protein like AT3G47110 [Hibiscus trionum]|uniref:Uncharacterized protein n=1 Tax=Hibiscus trionum TaxID=183268 RepID=A0A9W7J3G9_HIBTR|nr:hypothetical protein like AT3G47110 [Hibiscus trionum]